MIHYQWHSLHVAGVTCSTVGIRRRPNCFNIVHQLELLVRSGLTGQNAIGSLEASGYVLLASSYVMRVRVQAYESAAQMASVYSLGKQESTAAVALLHKIPGPIKAALTEMVRRGVLPICETCVLLESALSWLGSIQCLDLSLTRPSLS